MIDENLVLALLKKYTTSMRIKSSKTPVAICAFCAGQLCTTQIQKLKTLLNQGDKVLPNCGKQACLKLNPKANYDNGWTVTKKQVRKRRAPDPNSPVNAKKAKPNNPANSKKNKAPRKRRARKQSQPAPPKKRQKRNPNDK